MTDVFPPVLVLHHAGDAHRDRVWAYCRRQWRRMGRRVVTGSSARGLYAARNAASRRAGEWRIAIFADADIITPELELGDLLDVEGDEYVCLYSELRYLGRATTETLITTGELVDDDADEVLQGGWLGCFAIGRELWDDLGGFDERFAGRPGQDVAFHIAASTLGRASRRGCRALHLWHEPVAGRVPDDVLLPRYREVAGDREAMRAVIRR